MRTGKCCLCCEDIPTEARDGRLPKWCQRCRETATPPCKACGAKVAVGKRGWAARLCDACRPKADRHLINRSCVQCGTIFHPKGRRLTCSDGCRQQHRHIHDNARHKYQCSQCGAAFTSSKKGRAVCSPKCRVDSRRSTPTKCRWCGCSVPPKKGDNKGMYCSRQCTFKQWGFESSLKATQKEFRSRLRLLVRQKARDAKAIEVAVRKAARNSATCKTCGIVFMRKWTTCPPTTCIECRVDVKRANRKTRKVAHKQLIKEVVTHEEKRFLSLRAIHRRDCGICYICGKLTLFSVDPNHDDYPNRDHVIPLSRGGRHSLDNLRTACRACNLSKRDMTIAEFIKSR